MDDNILARRSRWSEKAISLEQFQEWSYTAYRKPSNM